VPARPCWAELRAVPRAGPRRSGHAEGRGPDVTRRVRSAQSAAAYNLTLAAAASGKGQMVEGLAVRRVLPQQSEPVRVDRAHECRAEIVYRSGAEPFFHASGYADLQHITGPLCERERDDPHRIGTAGHQLREPLRNDLQVRAAVQHRRLRVTLERQVPSHSADLVVGRGAIAAERLFCAFAPLNWRIRYARRYRGYGSDGHASVAASPYREGRSQRLRAASNLDIRGAGCTPVAKRRLCELVRPSGVVNVLEKPPLWVVPLATYRPLRFPRSGLPASILSAGLNPAV
jgi:hypothetical protein